MSLIRFKSFNDEFCVEISNSIFDTIKNECIKARNNETGGILIGKYLDKNNAIIIEITGPTEDTKQGRSELIRGTSGLIKLLDTKWDFGEYYVGEWHSHPNASTRPSRIDDSQMKELACDNLLKCPEPILLIVGGNQNNGWKFSLNVYNGEDRISLVSG